MQQHRELFIRLQCKRRKARGPSCRQDHLLCHSERQGSALDGAPFKIDGTNNCYMHYGTNEMIDSLLDDAASMGPNTISVWGFMKGVSHDHSMQSEPGVYEKAGVNSAWARLDYTVAGAKKRGIRVAVMLTNYWPDFGGMPQYAKWFNKPHQEAFYTDKKIIECYKKHIEHMVNRKNKYTGIVNKDEPAIMIWELANEPRCESDKTANTIVNWAKDMSSYIPKLAPWQFIAVGSEGFFNRKGSDDCAYNGYSAVDWERLIEFPDVNYGTFNLYPSTMVKPQEEKRARSGSSITPKPPMRQASPASSTWTTTDSACCMTARPPAPSSRTPA